MALFTGKIFQPQEVSSTDTTTWCIGTMEIGEKDRISADLSLPTNNDYFALRQPKFEIVTPPPVVLSDQIAGSTTVRTGQVVPTDGTNVVVHADFSITPIPRTRSVQRKPLPTEPLIYSGGREEYNRFSSSSHQSSIRRLPPIPRGPRPVTLLSFMEEQETPPPSYRSTRTHGRRRSVSNSVPSHNYSGSLDSVVSDVSLVSGSTLSGSARGDSLSDDSFPGQN